MLFRSLAGRIGSVLEVLYLIFNEGYTATSGDDWMRPQLCEEAMRLGRVLADYDLLWEEMGAVRNASGDYELACAPIAAPDLENIPSKKRSEARKRHELLCSLAEGVCLNLRARS